MVVSIAIANSMVSKVLIDQGSSTNILYWKTFKRLEISLATIQPHYGPLPGFTGESGNQRLCRPKDHLWSGQALTEFHCKILNY